MNLNTGNYKNSQQVQAKKEKEKILRYIIIGLTIFSFLINLSLFIFPFSTDRFEDNTLTPIDVLTFTKDNVMTLIMFVVLFLTTAASTVLLISSLTKRKQSLSSYANASRKLIFFDLIVAGFYFVAGVVFSTIMNFKENYYESDAGIIPLILSAICAIAFAFVTGNIQVMKDKGSKKSKHRTERIEFLIYGLIISAISVFACLSDIIKVKFEDTTFINDFKINGLNVLRSYTTRDHGVQMLAFFIIAMLTIVISLALMSLISFISRSKMFYKITLISVIIGCISTLVVSLFGQYYEIVQKINEEMIFDFVSDYIGFINIDLVYKVNSDTIFYFFGAVLVFLVILIRKPYTKGVLGDAVVRVDSVPGDMGYGSAAESHPSVGQISTHPDPCPAFTEIDSKAQGFTQNIENLEQYKIDSPSLPELVQFVVNYARDSRLHLSYKPEDIAAFIAGLGSTRLTILQGMSGTGKTSLPKIFTEAIFGRCDIVEVESSWRDKNELLGYYNEFSRIYTPKKFTQALYRAKLNTKQITFIVLDEMNLSRIEYYFSDFLSLMENEENMREIKLLNVGLYRNLNGAPSSYLGLTDGHTIKIPNNVWFIGTANRDESTFEISDKVYDRAHTMNFNKRAPKVTYYHDPISPRYLSVYQFIKLLEEAKENVKFDIETSTVVREVEALLAPYNITFGNRVANQIEHFVSIYSSCFAPSDSVMKDGLETILLSKVVGKLEYKSVDNKEYLAAEFKRLGLNRCSEFISKLHED